MPLVTGVLIPLGLTAAASAKDPGIHLKNFSSGTTTLIRSSAEMKNIMKIVKSLEDSSLLIKDVTKITENKTKKQRGGYFGMLLDILGTRLVRNMLAGKESFELEME